MKSSYSVLIVAILGIGALFFALSTMPDSDPSEARIQSGSSGTPTATMAWHPYGYALPHWETAGLPPASLPPSTIDTAAQAISLTLESEFPSGFTPTLIETRLVSYDTFMQQFHHRPPEHYESDMGPIWLVGILAEGVTNDDILPRGQVPNTTMTPPEPVPGAYYGWDANAAFVTSWGALTPAGPRSMTALQQLQNEDLLIAEATDVPTLSPPMATAIPTVRPEDRWMLYSSTEMSRAAAAMLTAPPPQYGDSPTYADPIYTRDDAIGRALALLPTSAVTTQVDARLISFRTMQEQFLGTRPGDYTTDMPTGPIWLVGILGESFDRALLMGPAIGPYPTSVPQPIDGVFFALDANLGSKSYQGGLAADGVTESMEALIALPNESLTISPATPLP